MHFTGNLKVCAGLVSVFARPKYPMGSGGRARARTSGYRARMATPAGRRVLAARKKRGRHVLCPAHLKKPNGKK